MCRFYARRGSWLCLESCFICVGEVACVQEGGLFEEGKWTVCVNGGFYVIGGD